MSDGELLRAIREELYTAKRSVNAVRNHTKLHAAALRDSEERLDALIAQLEQRIPNAQGGPGTNGRADASTAATAER